MTNLFWILLFITLILTSPFIFVIIILIIKIILIIIVVIIGGIAEIGRYILTGLKSRKK